MALNWITIATLATLLLCDYSHSKTIMLIYKDSSEEQPRPQNVINIYTNNMMVSGKDVFDRMSAPNVESDVEIQPYDIFQQHIQNEDTNNENTNNAEDADYEPPNNDVRGEVIHSYDYTDNEAPNDEHTDDEVRYEEDAHKEIDNYDYTDLYPNNADAGNEVSNNMDANSKVLNDEDDENEDPHNEDAYNADVDIFNHGYYNGYYAPAFSHRNPYDGTIPFMPYWPTYSKTNIQSLEEKDEEQSQDHSEEHPKESNESIDPRVRYRYRSDEDDKSIKSNWETKDEDKSQDHESPNNENDVSAEVELFKLPVIDDAYSNINIQSWEAKNEDRSQDNRNERAKAWMAKRYDLRGLQLFTPDEDEKSPVNNDDNEFSDYTSEEEY